MRWIIFLMIVSNMMYSQTIDQHRWKERVIVISSDETSKKLLEAQVQELLMYKEGLKERKLVIYTCFNGSCTFYDLQNEPKIIPTIKDSEGFEFSLIGLDGGKKFSAKELVAIEKLFALIDGMPMRRQELKKNKKGNE